jgi:ATP-dependent Clp protease ATP-binding subunit ClpA
MQKRTPKDLVKALTRTCIQALEAAAVTAVERRHYEITPAHLLIGLLQERGSDFTTLLALHHLDLDAVRTALEAQCKELPAGSAGKPIFSQVLMQWVDDSLEHVTLPAGETAVRSGALFTQLWREPARYGGYALVRALRALPNGERLAILPLGELAKEEGEARKNPRPPPPRLDRRVIAHHATAGEDLVSVARRYAVDAEELARDNSLSVDWTAPEAGYLLRVQVLAQLFPPS